MKSKDLNVGDLVTYRKDLLGVEGFSGIIISIYENRDGIRYCSIKWDDGEQYIEEAKYIKVIAKAKTNGVKK